MSADPKGVEPMYLVLTRCAEALAPLNDEARAYACRYGHRTFDKQFSADECREACAFLRRLGYMEPRS